MKAISKGIYRRSRHGTKYVRRRIRADIRAAYPASQEYIVRSLGTADLRAKELARTERQWGELADAEKVAPPPLTRCTSSRPSALPKPRRCLLGQKYSRLGAIMLRIAAPLPP